MVEAVNSLTPQHNPIPAYRRPGWLTVCFSSVGVAIAFFVVVHFTYSGGVSTFAMDYANLAGIFGLAVSLVGFFLTLWVLWETERVNAEARRRVEAAVETARMAVQQAQEEGRKLLQGAALRLLAADVGALLRIAKEAQDGIERYLWSRVLDRCREAKLVALRLQYSPLLLEDENKGLLRGSTALARTINLLQKNPVDDGERRKDSSKQRKPLGEIVDLAVRIEGRLLGESFRT